MLDNRYNAILCEKMFGAVTIDSWLNAEETFTLSEMNIMVERAINNKIREAEELKQRKSCTKDEFDKAHQRYIDYAAAQKFITESQNERSEKVYAAIEKRAEELKKEKRRRIINLQDKQKEKLLKRMVMENKIEVKSEFERGIILGMLHLYADLIPDQYVDEIEKPE